jgi:hypothetical protein
VLIKGNFNQLLASLSPVSILTQEVENIVWTCLSQIVALDIWCSSSCTVNWREIGPSLDFLRSLGYPWTKELLLLVFPAFYGQLSFLLLEIHRPFI